MQDAVRPQRVPDRALEGRWAQAVAALWGLAEATVFFVVPDVWISRLALSSRRAALRGCACALAGALPGGVLLYLLGAGHEAAMLALFERLPAIDPGLVARVRAQLHALGGWALLVGGFSGAPYKLYAAQAMSAGLGLPVFIACSVIARGARFVAVALLVGGIARRAAARFGAATVNRIWWAAWIAFYALYWTLMPR
jgi:membrane protein YqaA with SNARE-associated domain